MLNTYDLPLKKHLCFLTSLLISIQFGFAANIPDNNVEANADCVPSMTYVDDNIRANPGADEIHLNIPGVGLTEKRFVAAELFAEFAKGGNTTIILKKYFICTEGNISENQVVMIHEREINMLFTKLILDKKSEVEVENKEPLHCDLINTRSNCLKVVTYAANIELPIMPGGFDVVWMQKEINEISEALLPEEQYGVSLSIFIPDPMTANSNSMPEAGMLPGFLFCSGGSYELDFSATDKDGDQITYALSDPFSFIPSSNEEDRFSESGAVQNTEGDLLENTLYRRPPFRTISDVTLHFSSESNNQDKSVFDLGENSGKFRFAPKNAQTYFIGMTIFDEREGEILSQHQMIFLIESI